MDVSYWLRQQLHASAEGFLWAVEQIPQERLYLTPRPNRWPVARLVYHMTCYEQRLAFPSLLQWLGKPGPTVRTQEEDEREEDRRWNGGQGHEIAQMMTDFKVVRSQQLEVLSKLTEPMWYEEREVIWGHLPLKWVVTKTYQHTLEHTDEILRAYLWWR